jgi:hypothetical protein
VARLGLAPLATEARVDPLDAATLVVGEAAALDQSRFDIDHVSH